MELSHTAVKNDAKEVTHYDLKADGVVVGQAFKTDKGKFTFKSTLGNIEEPVATMRDLKTAVINLDGLTDHVKANAAAKPAKEPKPAKSATKAAKSAEELEQEERERIETETVSTDEDIDLD